MLLLRFWAIIFALLGLYPCPLTLEASAFLPRQVPAVRVEPRHQQQQPKTPAPAMSLTPEYRVRECAGGEDYSAVIGSVDAWWGGRRVSPMLPRLFFEHFCDTSFVVVTCKKSEPVAASEPPQTPNRPERQERSTAAQSGDGERDEIIVGFLCGFVSQSRTGEVGAVDR